MAGQILPDEKDIKAICHLMQARLGFKFGDEKVPLIISRLGKRIRELKLTSYQQYIQRITLDSSEETICINLLTTNVTQFFREPWQFHFVIQNVLPHFLETKQDKTLRCWSAGCATGEEPYTLGMVFYEHLPRNWRVKILASDVCTASLQTASEGIYPKDLVKDVPKDLLSKYFTASGNTYKVSNRLRQSVWFKQINLIEGSLLPSRIILDMIFCRNVFIYFTKETQKKVLDVFYRYLMPGGYLFLGHSESIDTQLDRRWKPMKGNVYQKFEESRFV